jgi:hypothetical protein
MRFAVAVAAFAGLAAALAVADEAGDDYISTAYETQYFTVTSCKPEVTDCPARSTVVSSTIIPTVTSSYIPSYSVPTLSTVLTAPTVAITSAVGCSVSVETISTSYTTVVPTVTYITHEAVCETTATASPVVPTTTVVPIYPSHTGNGT